MFRRRLMPGLFALLGPVALGSCVDDSVSLRIECSLVPESGECSYDPTGECWLLGQLNVAARNNYVVALRIFNGLKPRNREVPPLSEPNGVQVYEVEVQVSDGAGNRLNLGGLPNPYTVPASGYAPPGEEAALGAELLPASYVNRLRGMGSVDTVRLSVIARGRTSGDVDVESQRWPWAVRLVNIPTDPASGQCVTLEDVACSFGQDGEANVCKQTGEE